MTARKPTMRELVAEARRRFPAPANASSSEQQRAAQQQQQWMSDNYGEMGSLNDED